jgi:hypothetical protein
VNIEPNELSVRELVDDYEDNDELGVVAFGGELDVRPPYQREFVYKDKQRDAVMETVAKNFPLNVMYWAVRDDGGFEVIDGQQRTISICQYIEGDYAVSILNVPEKRYFHNLQKDEQEKIYDYKLMVYRCEGSDSEKLEWFKIINISGLKLTNQELRNAVYHGPWVSDAKRYFSKNGSPGISIGKDYLKGEANRQEYLERAIEWISNGNVEGYMAVHQHDPTAIDVWNYFQSVINWVRATFTSYRGKEMKGQPWGSLYNQFKDEKLNPNKLEERIAALMVDEEVESKRGIYPYVLDGEERHLSLRAFNDAQKRKAYEEQQGICVKCGKRFELQEMAADHILAWSKGGKTVQNNCQMLCAFDNGSKGGK